MCCFAFSGSNLVVLIIKASVSCRCRETKRWNVPLSGPTQQATCSRQTDVSAAASERLIIRQQTALLVLLLLWSSLQARKVRYTLTLVDQLWVNQKLIFWTFTSPHKTPWCARSLFTSVWSRTGSILCLLSPYLLGQGVTLMWSIHSLHHYIPHLSWQTLWQLMIWVISLYFDAADVSPCQQAPLTKQDGEPSSFKVLHMSLPSPLSSPPPTPPFRIPWDTGPCPILMVGKHILIDACVLKPNEKICQSDTQEQKAVITV